VYSGIIKYINGNLSTISEIKSFYSNKNILASAIFVKIPFALWLTTFSRKWLKLLGVTGTLLAFTAIFFMSTRAFYIGTLSLTVLLISFYILRFYQSRDKYQLKLTGLFMTLILSAFLLFSVTQYYLYPKSKDTYNKSLVSRLATISSEMSANARLEGWIRSWHVFKEKPLLGVGLGNWKITTIKEENLSSPDYRTVLLKAHNDFIEITTETGIFGGLFFIAMFILSGWAFIRVMFKKPSPEWIMLLFLPAFGLLCYSFDAFFNFPQDRAEIQSLFALYIGMVIAFTSLYSKDHLRSSQKKAIEQTSGYESLIASLPLTLPPAQPPGIKNYHFRIPLILIYGLALPMCIYILYQNFISLKLQLIVSEDVLKGTYNYPASIFLEGFPAIPNLTMHGEPIAVQKARYLINEQRNDEALSLLKNDRSSPFDYRTEFFTAFAYYNKNNFDSSLVYLKKVYEAKPYFFTNISHLCDLLQKKGQQKEEEAILNKYLSKIRSNKEALLYASAFYERSGNIKKAVSTIDSAAVYFPSDSLVLIQKSRLDQKVDIIPFQSTYDAATRAYYAKRYFEAARYYTELLTNKPDFSEAREFRADCYSMIKEFRKSNLDLDFLISKGITRPRLYNLMGVNYNNLGNKVEACKNFKIAADNGDRDGLINYSKVCQSLQKK
jgi:tetratricopeptide (TPR) repeat protein